MKSRMSRKGKRRADDRKIKPVTRRSRRVAVANKRNNGGNEHGPATQTEYA